MTDFFAYLKSIGVGIRVRGDKILVHPARNLRDGDADFIRANRAEIIALLSDTGGPCPGVCPGATNEMCCGCPDPVIELMFPSGQIAPQLCSESMEADATHWRERGGKWERIKP